jgi:hypothetical protein
VNPYFLFWVSWIFAGLGVEGWAFWKSKRVRGGVDGVDTLSSFTQWLVRAHQGDAGVSHFIFLALWGLLAAWFPLHILG